MTTSYKAVERAMSDALDPFESFADLPTHRESVDRYTLVRSTIEREPGRFLAPTKTILSAPGDTAKMALAGGDDLPIYDLALSASDRSGWDVCPFAGACALGCVGDAGNGGYAMVRSVRHARTVMVVEETGFFLSMLVHEIDRGVAKFGKIAVRLNAYSDIRWERVLPRWFWDRYETTVSFYDYTKHPMASRPMDTMPSNYTLTYSYSEWTTARNLKATVDAGRNVAVVVSTRGGYQKNGTKRAIPTTVLGMPTIDGDEHDRRYSDPKGVAVVLRRKGTLKADSLFVVAV